MEWILRWRIRRAERALNEARLRCEALDLLDADYGGVLTEQLEEVHAIERRIFELTQRLANHSAADQPQPWPHYEWLSRSRPVHRSPHR